MEILIFVIVAGVLLIAFACCKVSGDCTREEEVRERRKNNDAKGGAVECTEDADPN